MEKIIGLTSGKKTYVVALIMIAYGVVTGDAEIILQGLAAAGLRNGIK